MNASEPTPENTANEFTTSHGLDRLDLMIEFLPILHSKEPEKSFISFQAWLKQKLKRPLTTQEEINLMKGVLEFINTEPGTIERSEAINYIFNAKFIE